MATAIAFDPVNGCGGTAEHTGAANPYFTGSFTLSGSKQLSVTISGNSNNGNFNYDVGFVAKDANGTTTSNTGRLAFGTTSGVYHGSTGTVSLSADLSSFVLPINLYFTCGGCNVEVNGSQYTTPIQWQNNDGWIIGGEAAHTHISKPTVTITKTSGTTITVSGGEKVCCVTTNSEWFTSPHTFTGLDQGTEYSFKCRQTCPDCPDNLVVESDPVTGVTWNIQAHFLASTPASIVVIATNIPGTAANDVRDVIWDLYDSNGRFIKGGLQRRSNQAVVFNESEMVPNTLYTFKAKTAGVKNEDGEYDNICEIDAYTTEAAEITGSGGDVSAHTLKVSVSWSPGTAYSSTCLIECNNQTMSLSSSGSVGFTGLNEGTNYTVSWTITNKYSETYSIGVVGEDGELTTVTGTTYWENTLNGGTSLTTKETVLGTISTSSKIIKFSSSSKNYSSDMMEERVSRGRIYDSGWVQVAQNTDYVFNNLEHNTEYTIYARIKDCIAFDTSGNSTGVNDSVKSMSIYTRLLSLIGQISEEHQHSLVTLWQARVGLNVVDNNTDKDAIDGTLFTFSSMSTTAKKANPPYQSAEVIESINGSTIGDYQTDKKIYSNNLTWYYCEYVVTASITDGYNVVSASVTAHTIFPASWIFSGGQWHRYMGHVYTNGEWVPAPVFICKNNNYIEPNGE